MIKIDQNITGLQYSIGISSLVPLQAKEKDNLHPALCYVNTECPEISRTHQLSQIKQYSLSDKHLIPKTAKPEENEPPHRPLSTPDRRAGDSLA